MPFHGTMSSRGFWVTRLIHHCAYCNKPVKKGEMAFRGTLFLDQRTLTFNWHFNCYPHSVSDYLLTHRPSSNLHQVVALLSPMTLLPTKLVEPYNPASNVGRRKRPISHSAGISPLAPTTVSSWNRKCPTLTERSWTSNLTSAVNWQGDSHDQLPIQRWSRRNCVYGQRPII